MDDIVALEQSGRTIVELYVCGQSLVESRHCSESLSLEKTFLMHLVIQPDAIEGAVIGPGYDTVTVLLVEIVSRSFVNRLDELVFSVTEPNFAINGGESAFAFV